MPRGVRCDGVLPPELPALPLDPERLDDAGMMLLLAGVVVVARQDAQKGNDLAAAFVAELEAARPRSVRILPYAPAMPPTVRRPTSKGGRRRKAAAAD